MRRAVFIVVAVLLFCPMGSFGQGLPSTPITLTDKITHLEGVWVLDPTKGVTVSYGEVTIWRNFTIECRTAH